MGLSKLYLFFYIQILKLRWWWCDWWHYRSSRLGQTFFCFLACLWPHYLGFLFQKTVCWGALRRRQMTFRRRATTAGTCTSSCVMLRRSWVCWDFLVFQTQKATTEPYSKFRGWRVFWSSTSTRPAWREPSWTAAPVQKRASMKSPPRRAVKAGCRGGLCLSVGSWWSQPAVCQDTSPWCMGWRTGNSAP